MEREREDERWKAYFEGAQRKADYRAGLIAAMVLNVNRGKSSDKLWEASDFFPYLAKKDGADDAPRELSTAATVEYLKQGFQLYVPTAFRQRVGLPD